uniref:Large subunit ribosomal protein L24 n=1 Tax=Tetraselmis sp. GSL018 TaxID=582737 RepID=A0A061R2Z6_9CHLO
MSGGPVRRVAGRMTKYDIRRKRGHIICNTWKIVRGDTVKIIAGKDKGLTGKVKKVIRDPYNPRVVMENLNMVWKHVKMQEGQEGGAKVRIPAPIQYSNVMLVDPVSGAAVRSVERMLEDGTKVRVSRGKNATGSVIPKAETALRRLTERNKPSVKDTPEEAVRRVTYDPERLVEDFRSFAAKVLAQPTYPRFQRPPLELENRKTGNRTGQGRDILPAAARAALRPPADFSGRP